MDKPGKIKLIGHEPSKRIEVEFTTEELGRAILHCLSLMLDGIDDCGCDWYTDQNGCVYISNDPAWQVSMVPDHAHLVDAANLLIYGRKLTLTTGEEGSDGHD